MIRRHAFFSNIPLQLSNTYQLDFGSQDNGYKTVDTGWNNVRGLSGDVLMLLDTENTLSTKTFTVLQNAYQGGDAATTNGGINMGGHESASLGFPISAWRDSIYTQGTTGDYVFSNLNNDKAYTLEFYGSRAGVTDVRESVIKINSVAKIFPNTTADGKGSITPAVFRKLKPREGKIQFNFGKNGNSSFGYLGIVRLLEEDPTLLVQAGPMRHYVEPSSGWEDKIYIHSGIVSSGQPLVIQQRNFQSWQSTSPEDGALIIDTPNVSEVLIENCSFRGNPYNALLMVNAPKVTVRNCRFFGKDPVAGNENSTGNAVHIEKPDTAQLLVEHCYMENMAAVLCENINRTDTDYIVRFNDVRNVQSYSGTGQHHRRAAFQLNNCAQINYKLYGNQIWGEPGKVSSEDCINIYGSAGTAVHPIEVYDNIAYGAYPKTIGDSFTGSGITTDCGQDKVLVPAYVNVYNNQFVANANAAMNLAAGHDVRYFNNRIVTYGLLEDGRPIGGQSGGVGIFDFYTTGADRFYNNSITGNYICYVVAGNRRVDETLGVAASDNVHLNYDQYDIDMEKLEWVRWLQKVDSKQWIIGTTNILID